MYQPLLTTTSSAPTWVDTSDPDVKAAVMRTARGVLVLPIWHGKGAQFVPGQGATAKLSIIVPQVPQGTQAWEVTPGEVRGLRFQRVNGGTKVTVPEFGLTTAILFTSDIALIESFQKQSRHNRQLAAEWTYKQAEAEVAKVQQVIEQLEREGQTLPDGLALMQDVRKRMQASADFWKSRHFEDAYREGQRALRPLRILMRAYWEKLTAGLDSPVSSPYALSLYTLPEHVRFIEEIKQKAVGGNILPGGDFETDPAQAVDAWRPQETTLDEVAMIAQRVTKLDIPPPPPKDPKDKKPPTVPTTPPPPTLSDRPIKGERALMLQIKPKDPINQPQALQRTFLAIHSPVVRLQPRSLVQISGWVCIPRPIQASLDGAMLYDSIGGEPLALRLTEVTAWKKFTLYRRVPASGTVQLTVALTGLGTVYFDDLRIQPLVVNTEATASTSPK
jgi:hypothetical protein